MLHGWLKVLARVAYVAGMLAIFGLASYLSFGQFVRRGVTPVPDLVGLSPEEGEGLLADHGLRGRWLEGEDRFDEHVPGGRILQHDPGAGSLVKKGSVVELILSRGRQLVEVPDLGGQALQAAQVNLAAAGLTVGRLVSVYTNHGEPGTVVQQHPGASSQVDRSTPVDLLVAVENSAYTFVMPDLVYLGFEEVRAFFVGRGFRLGSVKYEPYEGIEPGVVLRQYPLAGHPLRRQDVISLVVSAPTEGGDT